MTSDASSAAKYQKYLSKVENTLSAALIVAVLTWKDSFLHPIWSERIVRLLALLAAAGLNVVMNHPALMVAHAGGTKRLKIENSIRR